MAKRSAFFIEKDGTVLPSVENEPGLSRGLSNNRLASNVEPVHNDAEEPLVSPAMYETPSYEPGYPRHSPSAPKATFNNAEEPLVMPVMDFEKEQE